MERANRRGGGVLGHGGGELVGTLVVLAGK